MKIAIIGTGIAGNLAAYHLSKEHEVTIFEANSHIGGHTHTHSIELETRRYAIDTGFIVFNHKTYPEFTRLLHELDVETQPSNMSFSVKCESSGLEYNGNTLNTLFAQRRNLFSLSFYRMIRDILRFNHEAPSMLEANNMDLSLGEFLHVGGYGREFIEHYLVPMGAAIWSTDPAVMYQFPAGFFIRFFHNHGLLSVDERPQWYVIKGGSHEYVRKITEPFADRIRTNTKIEQVKRFPTHVVVKPSGEKAEQFDYVFIATHSDQALSMLSDASPMERQILGAIPYQENEAVLHTDSSVLPKRELAWAAWNYHILPRSQGRVPVTYNMNILQGIDAPVQFCVTLNNGNVINPDKILKRVTYHHPMFTPEGVSAQQQQQEINGVNRTYFCGAYWRYGFHEDGVVSALNAIKHFKENRHEQLPLRRAS
ncbi:MAG: FAD-dependent oxidoreductase [Gammaproteobacteria bacterium]|nr:MAG: FAD-dependent oxidoreductase [Gammaproteobacteria bacterium]